MIKTGDFVKTDRVGMIQVKTEISKGVFGGEDIFGRFLVVADPTPVEDPVEYLLMNGYQYEIGLNRVSRWTDILNEMERRAHG